MKAVGERLNLQGHLAGIANPSKSPLYAPGTLSSPYTIPFSFLDIFMLYLYLILRLGDIEGHKGTDGRYYVLDFARVFPPEARLNGDPSEKVFYPHSSYFILFFELFIPFKD
jgi:hypothetical protein